MRVWAIMYDAGMGRLGILGVVSDEDLRDGLREKADTLLRIHQCVAGQPFTRVQHPEPYYQDNDRVYRCGWLTLWARPFEVEVPEPAAEPETV